MSSQSSTWNESQSCTPVYAYYGNGLIFILRHNSTEPKSITDKSWDMDVLDRRVELIRTKYTLEWSEKI